MTTHLWVCSRLENITIPDSVTSIGGHVFSNCTSLKNITIPDSVTSIGDYAFSSCFSLKNIVIPGCVTSLGDYAFMGCSRLENITIPDSVTSLGDRAFSYCSILENITIPDSVTSLGGNVFYGCTKLEKRLRSQYGLDSSIYMGALIREACENLSIRDLLKPSTVIALKQSGVTVNEFRKYTPSERKTFFDGINAANVTSVASMLFMASSRFRGAFVDQEIESSINEGFASTLAKYQGMVKTGLINLGVFRNTTAGLITSGPSDSAASKCRK